MTTLFDIARSLILTERQRQPSLGWTAEHDAGHAEQLLKAASCYRSNASNPTPWSQSPGRRYGWPWAEEYWKPKTAREDLIRAGALYLAAEDAETYPAHKRHAHEYYDQVVRDLVLVLANEPLAQALAAAPPLVHPESYCHRCYGKNLSWSIDSGIWNAIMRPDGPDSPWLWDEIICPACFAELFEAKYPLTSFVLSLDPRTTGAGVFLSTDLKATQ